MSRSPRQSEHVFPTWLSFRYLLSGSFLEQLVKGLFPFSSLAWRVLMENSAKTVPPEMLVVIPSRLAYNSSPTRLLTADHP